jgi:RNA polymerase sigma factor (sigma-70 family)
MRQENQKQRPEANRSSRILRRVQRLLAGEMPDFSENPRAGSWEEFARLQGRRLFRIAAELRVPEDQIADLVQKVWLKILSNWASFRGPGGALQLLALSKKMMHDAAVDLLRHLDSARHASLEASAEEPMDAKASNPANVLEMMERREELRAGLANLRTKSPKYAWVLEEHFLKGRSAEELAREKHKTKHAIESQITRALKALRRLVTGPSSEGKPAPCEYPKKRGKNN